MAFKLAANFIDIIKQSMSQLHVELSSPEKQGESQFGLLDLLIVLAKHKKMIIGLPIAVAVLAAALSFLLPNVYKAGAKLLPPQQQQSSAAALLSQLGGAAGMAAGISGLKNPNDLYVAMLKSRTVADRLVAQFKLKDAYDTESLENARRELAANTTVTSGKDGLITIEVEDEDRQRVAKIANAYVTELLNLTRLLAVTEASQRRVFFERELEAAKNNLSKAEVSMKSALDTRGVISVDADSRALMETVAALRARASAKEIELNSVRAFVTTTHPDYLRLDEELRSLRAELSRLENGRAGTGSAGPSGGTAGGTPVGLENIKVLRDVKYYQMLYELLAKQYEVARLDEAKDPSIIQVLDPAIEPEKKVKPKRAMLVLMCAFFAFFAALVGAFLLELRQRVMQAPGKSARLDELRSLLRAK
ncbi:Wzz/FepE/Etk N-terminal domain-containing protein [Massilia sp. LC238]|uniref:Wzz/FepE/Etk N-terminal domain-containing protein n=1 Tax=Massilia sp. LC238 TaxID=1502852 RepID=UPI0035A657CF